MMVDFAEAMSRLYHSFFSQMKRESWSDLKLKELKIVHEFKASTERLEYSGCLFFEKFSIKDTSYNGTKGL